MKNSHALVLGATGASGQELVKQLLSDDDFSHVSIFVRKKPAIQHKKLIVHEIDFSRLSNYKGAIVGGVLFSALGTTLKDAGSKAQQYLVDYTYQLEFAKMASENCVSHYSLVSSAGSNKNAPFFYPKMKGALEEEVKKLRFERIHIFQPPLLIRQPDLMRSGEKRALKILNVLNRFGLLNSQRPLSVSDLAEKMVDAVKTDKTLGAKVYKSKDIFS
jgi:uncharacterized protein YbjT (DUF2867 family)